jgi:hypothetical protein
MKRIAPLLSIITLMLVGASTCSSAGNQASNTPATTHTATPLPVSIVTPAPTPIPTPSGFAIGETVTTTTGAKITVLQTAPASSNNQFETPPPGGHFLAAKIRECAGTMQDFVSPVGWSVKLADDTQVDGTSLSGGSPGPELPSSNLQPGNCVAGWVYFPLPASPAAIAIVPHNSDFFWRLS